MDWLFTNLKKKDLAGQAGYYFDSWLTQTACQNKYIYFRYFIFRYFTGLLELEQFAILNVTISDWDDYED